MGVHEYFVLDLFDDENLFIMLQIGSEDCTGRCSRTAVKPKGKILNKEVIHLK